MQYELLWQQLFNIKYAVIYSQMYLERGQRIDRWITIGSTVVSLSSVAAWKIWDVIPLLWTILITASQIINAIKPIFPYARFLGYLSFYIHDMDRLFVEISKEWRHIDLGNDDACNQCCDTFAEKLQLLGEKYFPSNSLPTVSRLQRIATKKAEEELKPYYPVKEDSYEG